jgi:predicted aspartyl protease
MGMGTFYIGAKIENISDRDKTVAIPKLLVDTGSEYTWVSGATLEKLGIQREKKDLAFVMANGQQITRSVGFAIVRVAQAFTVDEVVFAEKGDMLLLGARSLEGLNLEVDSRKKKLVAAGPLPVAVTTTARNKARAWGVVYGTHYVK